MTIRDYTIKLNDNNLKQNNHKRAFVGNLGLTKEQILLKDLKTIADEYVELEKIKTAFSTAILKNYKDLDFSRFTKFPRYYIKENYIKKKVSSANIRGLNVVSVDGSSISKKFMDVDFSFLKAIAVQYYFKENHVARIKYFPDLNGFNNYFVKANFINRDENSIDAKISLDMNYIEINLLNDMIERNSSIDLIIIDGSIVITPINLLFSKDPEISKKYDMLLKAYQRLYSNCKEHGIILIGSIKDTRTSALTNLLCDSIQLLKPTYSKLSDFIKLNYREVVKYLSDIGLFNRLLIKSERSCIFNCKTEIDKIRDTGIKKEIPYYFPLSFYAFYLKTAKYDTPCRLEFFMDEKHSIENASKKADLISSIILPISSLNDNYGLPIPQIEAHKRAVFKKNEIDILFNNLIRNLHLNGISLLEKRRNRRPF